MCRGQMEQAHLKPVGSKRRLCLHHWWVWKATEDWGGQSQIQASQKGRQKFWCASALESPEVWWGPVVLPYGTPPRKEGAADFPFRWNFQRMILEGSDIILLPPPPVTQKTHKTVTIKALEASVPPYPCSVDREEGWARPDCDLLSCRSGYVDWLRPWAINQAGNKHLCRVSWW